MQLHTIEDPRNPLQKLRRYQIEKWARENNIDYIEEGMPKVMMIRLLKANGIERLPFPEPTLGRPDIPDQSGSVVPEPGGGTINADDLMSANWQKPMAYGTEPSKVSKFKNSPMHAVRSACRNAGIKYSNTDTKIILLGKLNGHQDAS